MLALEPACARRSWSIARCLAAAISQAPGLRGTPARGHCSSAATSASCASSSATPTSRTMPRQAGDQLRRLDPPDGFDRAMGVGRRHGSDHIIVPDLVRTEGRDSSLYPVCAQRSARRSRSSCARSSGVTPSPKSSASNTWRISISDSPSWGLGQRSTHSIDLFLRSHLHQPEAGNQLLGLGERAVDDRALACRRTARARPSSWAAVPRRPA